MVLFLSKEYLDRNITFFDASHTINPQFLGNNTVCGALFSGGLRISPLTVQNKVELLYNKANI
jgi:hypothetical protein